MHDVIVIGGGPAGLTAGMYCRMRKLAVLIVDAGRIGGQLVQLYGDKPVHDWPGYAHVIAGQLGQTLVDHALELGVEIVASRKVTQLTRAADGSFEITAHDVATQAEVRYQAKAIVIAIGGGAFEARRLKVPGEDQLGDDSITHRMPDRARIAGRRVVIVGGGDSGLESAQMAHLGGAHVTMVQVLDHFTGMEANIDAVNQMEVQRHFNTRVKSLEVQNGKLRGVFAQTKGQPEPFRLDADYLVVNIGAAVNLDQVQSWGIEVRGNQIPVDGNMRTSLDGVFACGDIVTYDGKYKLLLTASSEGCVAANSAYVYVRKPPRVTMGELYT